MIIAFDALFLSPMRNFNYSRGSLFSYLMIIVFFSADIAAKQDDPNHESLTFTVTASGATSVRLHSNHFGWDQHHPKGVAKQNQDGTWSVHIRPAWLKNARYRWIVDGGKEYLTGEHAAGKCKKRILDGSIVRTQNEILRFWKSGSGNVKGEIAASCKFNEEKS